MDAEKILPRRSDALSPLHSPTSPEPADELLRLPPTTHRHTAVPGRVLVQPQLNHVPGSSATRVARLRKSTTGAVIEVAGNPYNLVRRISL